MNIKSIFCLALMAVMINNLSLPAIAEEEFWEDKAMVGQETSSAYSSADEEYTFSPESPESELPAAPEFSDSAPSEAAMVETGVERRIESRQERRTDTAENLYDGSQDRQEFREGRRDSVGEGADARVENRQEKRENRGGRGDDRRQDRTDRLNDRF